MDVEGEDVQSNRIQSKLSAANTWLSNAVKELEQQISEALKTRAAYREALLHLTVVQMALQLEAQLADSPAAAEHYPANSIWTYELDRQLVRQVINNHTVVGFNLEALEPLRHWKPGTEIVFNRLSRLLHFYQLKPIDTAVVSPSTVSGFPIDFLSLLVVLKSSAGSPQG
jgi:hypothetical protein